MKMAKHRITQIMPQDRPGTLVSVLSSRLCYVAVAEPLVIQYRSVTDTQTHDYRIYRA